MFTGAQNETTCMFWLWNNILLYCYTALSEAKDHAAKLVCDISKDIERRRKKLEKHFLRSIKVFVVTIKGQVNYTFSEIRDRLEISLRIIWQNLLTSPSYYFKDPNFK